MKFFYCRTKNESEWFSILGLQHTLCSEGTYYTAKDVAHVEELVFKAFSQT